MLFPYAWVLLILSGIASVSLICIPSNCNVNSCKTIFTLFGVFKDAADNSTDSGKTGRKSILCMHRILFYILLTVLLLVFIGSDINNNDATAINNFNLIIPLCIIFIVSIFFISSIIMKLRSADHDVINGLDLSTERNVIESIKNVCIEDIKVDLFEVNHWNYKVSINLFEIERNNNKYTTWLRVPKSLMFERLRYLSTKAVNIDIKDNKANTVTAHTLEKYCYNDATTVGNDVFTISNNKDATQSSTSNHVETEIKKVGYQFVSQILTNITLYLSFDVGTATHRSEINEIRKNFGGELGQITSSLFF